MNGRRWAWAEVDLDAVSHNIGALKALTAPVTQFMAVVKADAYGHGARGVSEAALDAGADRLGVGTIDEALFLRRAGITVPLQLLTEPPPEAARLVVKHDLVPALHSRDFAVALSREAALAEQTSRFHLKVNTGMNRLGVGAEDASDFIESLTGLAGIAMEGVFTHFATADVAGDWEFERQLQRFTSAIREMRARRIDPGIVHAANSAATILHRESHFDMVRCGIAVYGLHPSEATHHRVDLHPVMSVKARLAQVRRISLGDGASYGFTWRAGAPATLATLPLGYADGVRRNLSNEMDVLVGGVRCRQVGRICMDQMVVELPRGVTARAGDEAVIIGAQGDEAISIDEQAEKLGTINYEVACGYGARLERCCIRR